MRRRRLCTPMMIFWGFVAATMIRSLAAQPTTTAEIDRPPPPPFESFEEDANQDGIPDGWYNVRDASLVEGGVDGRLCLRFESARPGRPARVARGFGVDGRRTEALVIGLWVRLEEIGPGERVGEAPGLTLDLIGEGLQPVGQRALGPWTGQVGPRWTRVAKRVDIPPGTRDVILTVGLLGATGVMEIDAMTIEQIPVGGQPSTNLVRNGDFELGDPQPFGWVLEGDARRVHPGHRSDSALELSRAGSRALTGLALPVGSFGRLDVTLAARASGLRGAGGAALTVFVLDDAGRLLSGFETGRRLFRWGGSFDWRPQQAALAVPAGAGFAVLQVEKPDAAGSIRVDDLRVTASPEPRAGQWTPYHVQTDTSGWFPVPPSEGIEAGSALDFSFLLRPPIAERGPVTVREGRLHFETDGARARFFGVTLIAPSAFQDPDRADALAERLARTGVNLVRLGDLDAPLGPGRSLFDDGRDDTAALDPVALDRLDHLIAALKDREIAVALELQSLRRYREDDDVPEPTKLPDGGGPAFAFDPELRARALETAEALLGRVNPQTGQPLRDDPVLAWLTLAGELTLFDLIDEPNALPTSLASALRTLARQGTLGTGRRFWQATESAQWRAMAEALRAFGLKVPIAGSSHWRREPEFASAQAAEGLDLIDDRLFWHPPSWAPPERRSMLWDRDGGLAALADRKRRPDRPYVVGQWALLTRGAWALPFEAADLLLAARTARVEDWDALVRRGVFFRPDPWGAAATGTSGGDDLFLIPEVVNAIPPVFALLPHAASLMLRDDDSASTPPARPTPGRSRTAPARSRVPGGDPARGRLVLDTPFTQGLAGWFDREPVNLEALTVRTDNPYAVVVASAVGPEPIAEARRLLVSAIARCEPTDLRWADAWQLEVASPGQPPLLQEPVRAEVVWRRTGSEPIQAFVLDNTGARVEAVPLERTPDGFRLVIDGSRPAFHWELVAE